MIGLVGNVPPAYVRQSVDWLDNDCAAIQRAQARSKTFAISWLAPYSTLRCEEVAPDFLVCPDRYDPHQPDIVTNFSMSTTAAAF